MPQKPDFEKADAALESALLALSCSEEFSDGLHPKRQIQYFDLLRAVNGLRVRVQKLQKGLQSENKL